jgi:glutaredoxin
MSQTETDQQVHLYWATGCTSCLRAKEFLERNGVSFVSHNVVENRSLLDDMEEQGMPRQVPIVRRGDEWMEARYLDDVARIADVEHKADPLPVAELYRRLEGVLEAALDYVERIPEPELDTNIPNRPRSYGELAYHIFSIAEAFLDHEAGNTVNSSRPEAEWASHSKDSLVTYGQHVLARLRDWRESPGWERDWAETANIHYGDPTVHGFFERTTWHAGQHTRQLEWILEHRFDCGHAPLNSDLWEGLPMPKQVWDAL